MCFSSGINSKLSRVKKPDLFVSFLANSEVKVLYRVIENRGKAPVPISNLQIFNMHL